MKSRIVLLPDSAIEKLAQEYSSSISSSFPAYFRLDDQHITHATLIHIEFDEAQIKMITARVKDILIQQKSIITQANDVRIDDSTYIGVYFDENKEIIKLREKLFTALKDIINSSSPFRTPHITISRLPDPENAKKALQTVEDFPHREITFQSIAIGDSCENGTVSKLFTVIPLH